MERMNGIFRHPRGTAEQLARSNRALADGVLGIERDTGRMKLGDGRTHWNDLPYLDELQAAALEVSVDLDADIDIDIDLGGKGDGKGLL